MASDDNIFDPKKIIDALRAKGISDSEIAKLYGPEAIKPKKDTTQPNSERVRKFQKDQEWKYKNKHKREKRMEDLDPDYEPIKELQPKTSPKKPKSTPKKPKKKEKTKKQPKTSKKKATKPKQPKNIWDKTAEERLKNLYEAGYSLSEIAKEFNTTPDAISGKITRLKNAGWKGMVGTTHNPLPQSTPEQTKSKSKQDLSPDIKRALSTILKDNFGVIGAYFSKRWGLENDKIDIVGGRKSTGAKGDISAAVTKTHQEIVSALIKLDMSIRRGTTSLTKAISLSTAKIADGLTATEDLIKRSAVMDVTEKPTDGEQTTNGNKGNFGAIGTSLLAGSALAAMLSDRSEASTNFNDRVEDNRSSEDVLRDEGAREQEDEDSTPDEIKIKVKELTYEADQIEFETDDLRFKSRVSGQNVFPGGTMSNGNGVTGPAVATPSPSGGSPAIGSGGTTTTTPAETSSGGIGGFFSNLKKKFFGGGESGSSNSNKAGTTPSSKSAPTTSGQASPQSSNDTGPSSTLAEQRAPMAEEIEKDPALKENIKAMASAEEGTGAENSDARKALMETMLNRAKSHSINLKSIVTNKAYYQPYNNGSYERHLDKVRTSDEYSKQLDKELNEVLKGSNYSGYATHNGSSSVGDRAQQTQSTGWIAPNGETFSRKDREDYSYIHGAGTTQKEGDWFRQTKAADDAAKALAAKKKQDADPMATGSTSIPTAPTTGAELNNAQRQKDDDIIRDNTSIPTPTPSPGPQSNSDDVPGGMSKATVQTTLLQTQGPNHFSDFPMSDQGVGA